MEYKYHRISGYIFTIILHVGNLTYLSVYFPYKVLLKPELRDLENLQGRFFTNWNVFIQIMYAFAGLICEVLLIINADKKNYNLPKYIRGFRDVLFASILWPSTWVVCTVFWSLCLYDKSLIFPKHTEELLNPVSNHIMHTIIVPIAFWELWYRRRKEPRSHKKYLYHLAFHFALYFGVLMYTYVERGKWIYPVFGKLYGTIYFPLLEAVIFSFAILTYYLQWPLSKQIWREKRKVN